MAGRAAAVRGEPAAAGRGGARRTVRKEKRGCGGGLGRGARAGIRAYKNGMDACRLDMKARPAGECYGSHAAPAAPVCPGVRLCARAARPPAPRPSAGGAPAPAALRPSAGGVRLCARAALRVLPRHAYAPRAVPPRDLPCRSRLPGVRLCARAARPPAPRLRPPRPLSRTGRTRPRSSSGTPCPQTAGRAARACSPCDRSAGPCSGRP